MKIESEESDLVQDPATAPDPAIVLVEIPLREDLLHTDGLTELTVVDPKNKIVLRNNSGSLNQSKEQAQAA